MGEPQPRTRQITRAGLVLVVAWLWLSMRPSAPLHEDTSRDLAFARDLADGTVLHLHGAWASFVSLHQGTTWIDFLALGRLAGLGVAGIERVLTALLAMTVALSYLGFAALLPRRQPGPTDSLIAELAPLVGALVSLAAIPLVCEMPILWQPTLLPVPILLAHVSMWRLLRDGELVDALALAVLCAVALDVHVASVVLISLAAIVVPLAARRPLIATPSALMLGLAYLWLCSPDALSANLAIMSEQDWLVPALVVAALAVGLGVGLRARFADLSWEARLRLALGTELALLAVVVAASLLEVTPALTGRYLLPFVPAVAFAAALASSWARSRASAVVSAVLAGVLLLLSLERLRPAPERALPSYPEWRVAEFDPIADVLVERGHTWTELVAALQGPSWLTVLGHLSAIVEPGSPEQARPTAGLLLLGLEPGDADALEAELPAERVTTIELHSARALLLETPARSDRLGAQLCREGQDCQDVVIAVTSRVYQAHPNAWIGSQTAQEWLAANGEPRDVQWRVPIHAGEPVVLVLSSIMPEHCAWHFVASEGFEPTTALPTAVLELPADAEGTLLVTRSLDPDEPACREHGLLPPAIIETAPGWTTLRGLLAPQ